MAKDWGIAGVWNSSLNRVSARTYEPRDYLWASELGKAPVDVWYALQGTVPTNPPNARAQRKFEAGNVFEWIISLMLKRAGILVDEQVRCEYQYPGLLKVTGKCDFIAGGEPNFAKAIAELKALDMPEVFINAAEAMKDYFEKKFPTGLKPKPIEVKSLSAFMFEALLARNEASKNHRLQCFHYLKSLGYEKGSILYVCRDDLRIMEVPVLNGGRFEEEYKEVVAEHSGYFQRGETPPLEQPIVYDPDVAKFAANWKIGYSMYLSMLYGLKDQGEFDSKYKSTPPRWNRVLNRFRKGEKMTKANIEVLKEIKGARGS
jgi:hypothetical protein